MNYQCSLYYDIKSYYTYYETVDHYEGNMINFVTVVEKEVPRNGTRGNAGDTVRSAR